MKLLLQYLNSIDCGRILETAELESLLADCWEHFDGWNAEGMAGDKLLDRTEEVAWEPPVLRFKIERHGRSVCGSTRADLHKWDVDSASLG